jgi:hypothetical protein
MKLECRDEQLKFVLGEIGQSSLRQVGTTPLEGGILLNELFERLEHLDLRLHHLAGPSLAAPGSHYTYARSTASALHNLSHDDTGGEGLSNLS